MVDIFTTHRRRPARADVNCREPSPTGDECVKLGDVGYIREGGFHLLFSAGIPLGDRVLGTHVPHSFKQLDIGPIWRRYREGGCLYSVGVKGIRADVEGSVAVTQYV